MKTRPGTRQAPALARRRLARPLRARIERLEARELLDAGASILIGRTLSSYFAGSVQDNRVTITYTAYNEGADPETGVRLTDTLAPGVTLLDSSVPPDRSGQDLAWSLGTIPGFGRASVTITLGLPAGGATTLDAGAGVSAALGAGTVADSAPPAALRTDAPPDPSLLAATPDANAADPFVQEAAARLDYDPQRIFAFVRDQVGYESYDGSLRGARGTLWSGAGNSLDKASLLVALLRASGTPARYDQGTLAPGQAQQLILSMFPDPTSVLGCLADGTPTADPADDPQLLSESEPHFWAEFDAGGGFQAADPDFAGAAIGQTFTAQAGAPFAEVPDALRQKVEVQLKAEITSQAASLFGLGGAAPSTVLDETFNAVDLVGRPLSVGNYVAATGVGILAFSASTITYTPYLVIGQGDGDIGSAPIHLGTPYQEVLTNFPLSSSYLTGLFLDVTTMGPEANGQRASSTVEKTLFDRIGYAARQGGAPGAVSVSADAGPAVSDLDITTLEIDPAAGSDAVLAAEQRSLAAAAVAITAQGPALAGDSPDPAAVAQSVSLARNELMELTATVGQRFRLESDMTSQSMAGALLTREYPDSPRIVAVSSKATVDPATPTQSTLSLSVDILRNDVRVVSMPGQFQGAAPLFRFTKGIVDSLTEQQVLGGLSPTGSTGSMAIILQALATPGTSLIPIGPDSPARLAALNLPADAAARIAQAVQEGRFALVPSMVPTVGGRPRVAWIEVDPNTGSSIAVSDDGTHNEEEDVTVRTTSTTTTTTTLRAQSAGARLAMDVASQVNDLIAAGRFKDAKILIVNFEGALAAIGGVMIFDFWNELALTRIVGGFAGFVAFYQQFDPPTGDVLLSAPLSPEFANLGAGAGGPIAEAIAPDPRFTIPFSGAQLPTVFKAGIKNLTGAADGYNLSVSGLPAGFHADTSVPSLKLGPGQTAEVGICVHPEDALPAPGTPITFTLTATSTTNPSESVSQSFTFNMPDVHAVTITPTPIGLSTSPGSAATDTLKVRNAGNVPETVSLAATASPGVTAGRLPTSLTLAPGESADMPLTLTPGASTPFGSVLSTTVTATFGPADAPLTQSATIVTRVVAPGAAAATAASITARQAGNAPMADLLDDLGTALTDLAQNSADTVALERARFLLGNLDMLLQADPALSGLSAALQPLRAAAGSGDVGGLLGQAPAFFNSLTPLLTQEADQQFTATLSPTEADLAPGEGKAFTLQLTSASPDPIDLTLAAGNLPAGVSVDLGQSQVTLSPGQTLSLPVTLSETVQSTRVFTLWVAASASLVHHSATAVVAIRPATADILSVSVSPGTVNPGTPVQLSAQVFNTANAARTLLAHADLLDASGNVLKPLSDTPVTLTPGTDAVTLALPSIDSTGLGVGVYYARIQLEGADGGPIPGHSAQASFLVSISVSASISTSPAIVPPGTSSVTTTISVAGDNSVGSPGGSPGNSIELYYTRFGGFPSVQKVQVSYDGTSLNVGTPVTVSQNVPADGAIFLPDGRLVVANGPVSFVNPLTGAFTSVNGFGAEHLALDPSGTKIWTSPQPGSLVEIPLASPQNGVVHPLQGDDIFVTQLAFDEQGTAYYTTGGQNGFGNVGIIDLTTFTTRRFLSNLPGAHGIIFDPYTGDLFICNINHITQIDPTTMQVVSDFVDPNGSAFDQGSVDGKGHIYVADAGNGHLEFIDYTQSKLVGDPSNFHAAPFVTSTLDDVAPLVGLGSLGVLTDVTENLAPGFAVDANSITPAPSSSSATQVEWFGNIPLTDTTIHTFQLTGTVANMAPGEVRQISAGSTVIAQATVASGQQLTNTINLPPVFVAAQHIISLDPASATSPRGATVTYQVSLPNPRTTPETYTLSLDGLDGLTTGLTPTVDVAPGQTVQVPLTVSVPLAQDAGTRAFVVTARTLEGGTDSVEGQLMVTSDVNLPTRDLTLSLSPTRAVAGPGTPATFRVTVSNTGEVVTTYQLAASLPNGFSASFDRASVSPPPGGAVSVLLTIAPPAGASAGDVPFTVSATATTDASVTRSAPGTVAVVANGVGVALSPTSGPAGTTFQMTVTNTGSVADTYELSLGGPAALVATLGAGQVTLAPGESQTISVATGSAAGFALPGDLPLVGIATSRGNPDVRAAAASALTVDATHGVDSALTPSVKILPIPGTTSFLLLVTNTGNAEDTFTATITGTSGPVSASLVNPDGSLGLSIPLFRLPALASGALVIQADMAGQGLGGVTVRVASLTNPALSSTRTATVRVAATQAATVQLTVSPNPSAVGQAVTFTAVVTGPAGSPTPTGPIRFVIDGVVEPPVTLQPGAGGAAMATFTTSSLGPGTHVAAAVYGGDTQFTPVTSNFATNTVTAALADGPRVTDLQRFGIHMMPTTLVLTFDQALEPTRAQQADNYIITDARGRRIAVASAAYDAALRTVTLRPRRRLDVHRRYRLRIADGRLAGSNGLVLDGDGDGRPGGNYAARVDRSTLVLGAPTPRPARFHTAMSAVRHGRS